MEKQPLREWRFTCTAEEWLLLLKRGEVRKAGKVRIGVELGLLLLLAAYCLIAFFGDGMTDWRSFGIAVIAVIVGIVLLVVPEVRFRHEAEQLAQEGRERTVRLYEEGLAFGKSEEIVPFAQCGARVFEDMAVLRFREGALFGIPRRALPPEDWDLLCRRFPREDWVLEEEETGPAREDPEEPETAEKEPEAPDGGQESGQPGEFAQSLPETARGEKPEEPDSTGS